MLQASVFDLVSGSFTHAQRRRRIFKHARVYPDKSHLDRKPSDSQSIVILAVGLIPNHRHCQALVSLIVDQPSMSPKFLVLETQL